VKNKHDIKSFDKYYYYSQAVQSPENDVEFFENTYRELNNQQPRTLREDFCGTFANSCAWVKRDKTFRACGIDNDNEPLTYGKQHYLSKLSEEAKERVEVSKLDVLSPNLPSADIICALNFSYFCFKERTKLKTYLRSVYEQLNQNGILILDCFGGSDCHSANIEEIEHEEGEFSYFWDQDSFDPVSNNAQFYIHFKLHGEQQRREKVFSYNWRMWSIPEIREIMGRSWFQRNTHFLGRK
jgi:hypothetical protein